MSTSNKILAEKNRPQVWSFDQFHCQKKEKSDFVAVDQTTIEFAHGLNGVSFFPPFFVKHEPKCFCCVP